MIDNETLCKSQCFSGTKTAEDELQVGVLYSEETAKTPTFWILVLNLLWSKWPFNEERLAKELAELR